MQLAKYANFESLALSWPVEEAKSSPIVWHDLLFYRQTEEM